MHQPQGLAPGSNELLRAMPQPVITLLQESLSQISLPQGFVCFEAGETIRQVQFPISGLISLVISTQGELVEVGMIGREGRGRSAWRYPTFVFFCPWYRPDCRIVLLDPCRTSSTGYRHKRRGYGAR
jgi:hypothetical protein